MTSSSTSLSDKCGHELIEDQTAWYTDFRRCTLPTGHKGKHSDGRKAWNAKS